ncbi:hypothetical protein [Streptomyces sp. C10]|uniref:hypothetical protein n=1 Tax=Streptomyces sp. C10 TaxID=531941 RepID=UPI00397F37A3
MAWKYQTGAQWRRLPSGYGSRKSVYTPLRNWASIGGTWEKVFTALASRAKPGASSIGCWPWTPPSSRSPARRRAGPWSSSSPRVNQACMRLRAPNEMIFKVLDHVEVKSARQHTSAPGKVAARDEQ